MRSVRVRKCIVTRRFAKCVTALISNGVCSLRLRETLRDLFVSPNIFNAWVLSLWAAHAVCILPRDRARFFCCCFFSYSTTTRDPPHSGDSLYFLATNKPRGQTNVTSRPRHASPLRGLKCRFALFPRG